ncbi:uncharacterized protein LOC135498310 [Lineus longissimus]|uniref:uncharacterized protein LOC135498310 n=1 Tax=Lineus longissimus TaxID=88925 RepID=UPI00315C6825
MARFYASTPRSTAKTNRSIDESLIDNDDDDSSFQDAVTIRVVDALARFGERVKEKFDAQRQRLREVEVRMSRIENSVSAIDKKVDAILELLRGGDQRTSQSRVKVPAAVKSAVRAAYNIEDAGNDLKYNFNEGFKAACNERVTAHLVALVGDKQEGTAVNVIRVACHTYYTSLKKAKKEAASNQQEQMKKKRLLRSRQRRLFEAREKRLKSDTREREVWKKLKQQDMSEEETTDLEGEKVLRRRSHAGKRSAECNELIKKLDDRLSKSESCGPKYRRV